MDNLTSRVNDFFRKSLSFIDEQDLKREFSDTQAKYGKKLLQKDLEINSLDNEINYYNDKTKSVNNNINEVKNNLASIQQTLSK